MCLVNHIFMHSLKQSILVHVYYSAVSLLFAFVFVFEIVWLKVTFANGAKLFHMNLADLST